MSDLFRRFLSLTNSNAITVDSIGIIDDNQIQDLETLINSKRNINDSYSQIQTNSFLDLKSDKATTYTQTTTNTLLNLKSDRATTYTKTESDTNYYFKSDVYNKIENDNQLLLKANFNEIFTQTTTNTLLDLKSNNADVYTKTTTNTLLDLKSNTADVYTQSTTNTLLLLKANFNEIYTQTTTNSFLNLKSDKTATYTKSESDNNYYNKSQVYTKTENDTQLLLKANFNEIYTQSTTNSLLNLKSNNTDVYTKTTTNSLLDLKSNTTDVYTKTTTNSLFYNKAYIDSNLGQTTSALGGKQGVSDLTLTVAGLYPGQSPNVSWVVESNEVWRLSANAYNKKLQLQNGGPMGVSDVVAFDNNDGTVNFTSSISSNGTSMTLIKSLPNGGNLSSIISNTGTDGFSSLYLNTVYGNESTSESAQIWTGQNKGLNLRTTTNHPIEFNVNFDQRVLYLGTNRNITCSNNLFVNANITANSQAVVLNNDARLTNQRTPTDNSVDNTKVSDNALSISKINGLETILANKQGRSEESLTLSASNPIQPALIYVQNGVASWTLRPDTMGVLRLQRTGSFVDVFTASRDNGNVTFSNTVTASNFEVGGNSVVLNNDSRLSD